MENSFDLNNNSSFDKSANLSLEQEFAVAAFSSKVDEMSETQAKEMLVRVYGEMMVREATYQHLLKHQWGLDNFTDEI